MRRSRACPLRHTAPILSTSRQIVVPATGAGSACAATIACIAPLAAPKCSCLSAASAAGSAATAIAGTDRAKSRDIRITGKNILAVRFTEERPHLFRRLLQELQGGFQVGGKLRFRLADQATYVVPDYRPQQFHRIHFRRVGRLIMQLDLRLVLRHPLPNRDCRAQAATIHAQRHLLGNPSDDLLQQFPKCPCGGPALGHRVLAPAVRAARGRHALAEPRAGPMHGGRPAPNSPCLLGTPGASRPDSSAQTIVAPHFLARWAIPGSSRSCQRRTLPGRHRRARRWGHCGVGPSRRTMRRPSAKAEPVRPGLADPLRTPQPALELAWLGGLVDDGGLDPLGLLGGPLPRLAGSPAILESPEASRGIACCSTQRFMMYVATESLTATSAMVPPSMRHRIAFLRTLSF